LHFLLPGKERSTVLHGRKCKPEVWSRSVCQPLSQFDECWAKKGSLSGGEEGSLLTMCPKEALFEFSLSAHKLLIRAHCPHAALLLPAEPALADTRIQMVVSVTSGVAKQSRSWLKALGTLKWSPSSNLATI